MSDFPKFTDWLDLREWDYIGGVEPAPKPSKQYPVHKDENPAVHIGANSVDGKLARLITMLGKVDPQRAQWFAKLVSLPANAHRLERLTSQITNVQDLLNLIGTLERRQRSRADTVTM